MKMKPRGDSIVLCKNYKNSVTLSTTMLQTSLELEKVRFNSFVNVGEKSYT